jgi:hypothetical protein
MKRPLEQDYTSLTAYTRALEEYCDALAQPAAVHITWNSDGVRTVNGVPDYTPPAAQRTWVGLTDEEQQIASWSDGSFGLGARWAEAKLKEKNT